MFFLIKYYSVITLGEGIHVKIFGSSSKLENTIAVNSNTSNRATMSPHLLGE